MVLQGVPGGRTQAMESPDQLTDWPGLELHDEPGTNRTKDSMTVDTNTSMVAPCADTASSPNLLAPWPFEAVMRLMQQDAEERERSWHEGYSHGHYDGYQAGLREAEESMAEHWASVSRNVRAHAGRPSHSERRARELKNAKPRPTDYMGQLSCEEYMGLGRAA